MTKNTATTVGFIVAAAIPAAVLIPVEIASARSAWLGALSWLLLAANMYLWSAAVIFIFAVPVFLLFRRYNLLRWWSALGVGAIIGAGVSVILLVPNAREIRELAIFSLAGAASGFAFWLIWR